MNFIMPLLYGIATAFIASALFDVTGIDAFIAGLLGMIVGKIDALEDAN